MTALRTLGGATLANLRSVRPPTEPKEREACT